VNDDLLRDLAHRVHHRFYGKYRGTVTAVDEKTLRIKATVPAVLGTTPTGWCLPCVPYAGSQVGFFFLPEAGAAVWIEFEGGDVSYPIWTGCFWREGELPAQATPTTRGLVTQAKHQLLFDDDAEEVTLGDANGGTIKLAGDGVTTTRDSGTVTIGSDGVSINDDAFKVS
jgi:uncharacterized protein involved in type VI secretion and phage assembly